MAISAHRKLPRQAVWDYMRRNRASFKVSDILMLAPIKIDQLRRYFQALETANYIVVTEEAKKFKDKSFKLVKLTGVKAPVAKHNDHLLIDHNLKKSEERVISIRRYPIFLKVQKRILSLHKDGNEIRTSNMKDCGGRTTIKKELSRLIELGVLTVTKEEWRGTIYKADIEKIEIMIKEEEEKRCLST